MGEYQTRVGLLPGQVGTMQGEEMPNVIGDQRTP